jgi:large subunit ribosomal protein L23
MEIQKNKEARNESELISLLKTPVITEKSVNLAENQQYTFLVDKSLTKNDIHRVIEKLFDVQVLKVNTLIVPVKTKRVGKFRGKITRYKKAYVRLKKGYMISNLFD